MKKSAYKSNGHIDEFMTLCSLSYADSMVFSIQISYQNAHSVVALAFAPLISLRLFRSPVFLTQPYRG